MRSLTTVAGLLLLGVVMLSVARQGSQPIVEAEDSPPLGADPQVAESVALSSGVSSLPGRAVAWGSDASGQVGSTACDDNCISPLNVAQGAGLTASVVAVAAGGSAFSSSGHSLAVLDDGTVWSWGSDSDGQLGDGGGNTSKTTPVKVLSITNAVAVAAGGRHSLALLNSGLVASWGDDTFGQLGNGQNATDRISPSVIPNLSGVIAISAGQSHSLALLEDGTVRSWGADVEGQLGEGSGSEAQQAPVAASGLADVIAISAGQIHSLALESDGTVSAAGNDSAGQLGNGSPFSDEHSFVAISGVSGVREISAGSDHSLAMLTNGTLRAWGQDNQGQLGTGQFNQPSSTPTTVPGLTALRTISAGDQVSLAIGLNGKMFAWGSDTNGELGDGNPLARRDSPVSVSGPLGSGGAIVVDAANHVLVIQPLCDGQSVTLLGTEGGNVINGTAGVDVIHGLGGLDRLRGAGGNDLICGGEGDDIIEGGTGDNELRGDAGNDTLTYQNETAVVASLLRKSATQGADSDVLSSFTNLIGSAGNDTLTGSASSNEINGLGGSDDLFGSFGNDRLIGGEGADDFDGGPGSDTVSYAGLDDELLITLESPGEAVFAGTSEDLIAIENISGGDEDDLIFGSGEENTISGGNGDDVIGGLGGDDTINGNAGDDALSGGLDSDAIDGGDGTDEAIFGEERVQIQLIQGAGQATTDNGVDDLFEIEDITGSAEPDLIIGDNGPNVLKGQGGGDVMTGADGEDTLDGGPDDDDLQGGDDPDILLGGEGLDVARYSTIGDDVVVDLRDGSNNQGDRLKDVEGVFGGNGNDNLTGNDGPNEIRGSNGKDTITGLGGDDDLFGNGDDDTLDGGEGVDNVDGGDDIFDGGSDTITYPGSTPVTVNLSNGSNDQGDLILGIENVRGSGVEDTLTGDGGANILEGLGGDDTLTGGDGNDELIGGPGFDTVNYFGTSALTINLVDGTNNKGDTLSTVENVIGSTVGDTITGNGRPNLLDGRGGPDTIDGRGVDDELLGGGGNDILKGGPGTNDVCDGGPGNNDTATGCETLLGIP